MRVWDQVRMKTTDRMGARVQQGDGISGGALATIQKRPMLVLGLSTALLGAALAAWVADRSSRRRTMWHRLVRGRRRSKAALDLPPAVLKLLANPIVQSYLRSMVARQISRRMGR